MNEWKNVDNWKKVMVNDGAAGGDADGDGETVVMVVTTTMAHSL